mmetsp:Transcript_43622/g.44136  ORF Transcript_43622/g.44136 Transcript_43622/m.44136 type:complete len:93 (-) Transcript_43622:853-1131(-)
MMIRLLPLHSSSPPRYLRSRGGNCVTHSKAKRLISAQNEAIVEHVQRARPVAEVRSAPKNNSMDPQQQQQLQTLTSLSQLPPSHDASASIPY